MTEPRTPRGAYALPWRVGRKVGRTVYDASDALIGVMDTPDLAATVVTAVNRCTCGNEGRHGRLHQEDCPAFLIWIKATTASDDSGAQGCAGNDGGEL